MDVRRAELIRTVRSTGADADSLGAAWAALFGLDADLGAAAAFDLLAAEPRTKPSCGLLIDPGDTARARWDARVAAAAALLDAPVAARLFEEVFDELTADLDLAADVLARARPASTLTAGQRAKLSSISPAAAGATPRR